MDNQATTNLNVHVEKETICGCTCMQYIPLPNKRFHNDGTLEQGKTRDQNLMCLGRCTAFLLKYPKDSTLTNIYADNGVSKVSLDISLNGILKDRVRYNKKSKYFHEIWVQQAAKVNHCVALHFSQGDEFEEFEETLSSILDVLRGKEHSVEFEYRLVAFKPLHGKIAKTDMVTKSTEDICTEGPDPGPDPAPTIRNPQGNGQWEAQAAIGEPFAPAPFIPPSDVMTVYKNKMILKKPDRFTFDSSEIQCAKETSVKKTGVRRPVNSDSSLLPKMPSLSSIKRECVKLNENECFDETIYMHMRESESSDSDPVDDSTNAKLDSGHMGGDEDVKPGNENNEINENVFLPVETDQLQSRCQSCSSTDFNTTVFLPMEDKNNISLERGQSQSPGQSSSTDFNTTVFLPMEGKNNVPMESEQSQRSPIDFNTTVFLPMASPKDVILGTENSQTDFNSTVYLPKPRNRIQNNSDNITKATDEENTLRQIKLLEQAINSCNKSNAEKYAAELAQIGVNVTITINRK